MSEIILTKQTAPANPTAGKVTVYVNSAGVPTARNENGLETPLGVSGTGGDVSGPAGASDNSIAVFDGITGKLIKDSGSALSALEHVANKDVTGGYVGLTLSKINFKNALNTFTSFFTNANTAARTYTFQDRNGVIADDTDLASKETVTNKDATGGYVGLTLFKINFKNALNTFTSFFTNSNTTARTYTFQDRDGTIADNTDLAAIMSTIGPNAGFVDSANVTLSWSDTTRTLTVSPVVGSFSFYSSGVLSSKSAPENVVIPNTTGNYYFYFDSAGTLTYGTVFTDDFILLHTFVAAVYWSSTAGKAVPDATKELHTASVPSQVHLYLHDTRGTAYDIEAGGLSPSVTAEGSGALAAHCQVACSAGAIWDDAVKVAISARALTDNLPVVYRSGTSGNWTLDESTPYLVRTAGTGRAAYNQFTGTTWQLTEVPNLDFMLVHLFAIPGFTKSWMAIPGQNTYADIASARVAAPAEITSITGIPLAEHLDVATFIVQTSTAYTNAVKSRIRSVDTAGSPFIDWRVAQAGVAGAISTNHNDLGGLNVGDYLHQTAAQQSTTEYTTNKATTFGTVNDTLYPTVQAVKTYADSLVVGLLDDRGNYDASGNVFPSTGGSGTAGAILKGDTWYISVAGTLGGVAIAQGDAIRALIDTPGQTSGNWARMAAAGGDIAGTIHAATSKTTPVDADEVGIVDSAASFALKKLTWANLKATLKTYLDTLYAALAGSASQVFSVATATSGEHALRLEQRQDPFRNAAINGDMSVSQVNGTTLVTTGLATDTYVIDQHIVRAAGAAVTAGQSTDATGLPAGFAYNLKISGAASNTNVTHKHRIEAKNAARFASKRIAVSFWMYQDTGANLTGVTVKAFCPTTTADTFSAVTQEGATQTFTVVNGGTIAKYTSFITLGATNPAKGLEIDIDLNAALLAGTTCYITGEQIEAVASDATVGTDFEFVSNGENLRSCRRYLPVFGFGVLNEGLALGAFFSSTQGQFTFHFSEQTRIAVTGVAYSNVGHFSMEIIGISANACTVIAFASSGWDGARITTTGTGAPFTARDPGLFATASASAKIYFTGAQL